MTTVAEKVVSSGCLTNLGSPKAVRMASQKLRGQQMDVASAKHLYSAHGKVD